MSYQDYLKSKHWLEFRRKILTIRTKCQSCGKSNTRFNIHHKHYKTLGNERNEDVMVSCQNCHLINHEKKFNRYKSRNWQMDLKNKSARARKGHRNKYELLGGTIKRRCKRCGEEHHLFYKHYDTCGVRMIMFCPESKPRTEFIKIERGLNIPSLGGKKKTLEVIYENPT